MKKARRSTISSKPWEKKYSPSRTSTKKSRDSRVVNSFKPSNMNSTFESKDERESIDTEAMVSKTEIFDAILGDPNNAELKRRMENNRSLASRFTEEELLAELADR